MSGADELTAKSWLSAGWRTFKQFPVRLILPGLLYCGWTEVNGLWVTNIATHKDSPVWALFLFFGFVAASLFIGGAVAAGWPFLCLRLSRGLDVPVWRILDGFRRWRTGLLTLLFYMLICGIGLFLLLVPGLIWSSKFILSFYSIMDRELGAVQALKLSGRITTGYKWRLFKITMIVSASIMLAKVINALGSALESNLLIYLGYAANLVAWGFILPWIKCAEAIAYDRLLTRQETLEENPEERTIPASTPDVKDVKDSPKSTLRLLTNPSGASVAVDGRLVGTTSEEGVDVPWNKGTIVVSKTGYRPQLLRFTSDPNVPHYLVELKPSSTSPADAKDESVDMINSPKSIKSNTDVQVLRTPGSTNEVVTKKELYEAVLGDYEPILGEASKIYYIKKFEQFDQKGLGLSASWNWAAFLGTFYWPLWPLYRKIYWPYLALAGIVIFSNVIKRVGYLELAELVKGGAVLLPCFAFGLFGSAIYHRSVRKQISAAQSSVKDELELLNLLRRKGGVNAWVLWLVTPLLIFSVLLSHSPYRLKLGHFLYFLGY